MCVRHWRDMIYLSPITPPPAKPSRTWQTWAIYLYNTLHTLLTLILKIYEIQWITYAIGRFNSNSSHSTIDWMIDWLINWLYIWSMKRRHRCRCEAAQLNLSSPITNIKQWGIFGVQPLLLTLSKSSLRTSFHLLLNVRNRYCCYHFSVQNPKPPQKKFLVNLVSIWIWVRVFPLYVVLFELYYSNWLIYCHYTL